MAKFREVLSPLQQKSSGSANNSVTIYKSSGTFPNTLQNPTNVFCRCYLRGCNIINIIFPLCDSSLYVRQGSLMGGGGVKPKKTR